MSRSTLLDAIGVRATLLVQAMSYLVVTTSIFYNPVFRTLDESVMTNLEPSV